MTTIKKLGDTESVLKLLHSWIAELSKGNDVAATALLIKSDSWSPEAIRAAIESYGHSIEPNRITSIEETKGGLEPRHDVEWSSSSSDEDVVGEVLFDLPVNGEWSDLTATFFLKRVPQGLAVELNDIHVM